MQEIFGKMLVTHPLSKNETQLPSPEQLAYKIILKCKKLPKHAKDTIEDAEKEKNDLMDSIRNGKMYIKEGKTWESYFFILTKDKLIYTEIDEGHNDYESIESNNVCT